MIHLKPATARGALLVVLLMGALGSPTQARAQGMPARPILPIDEPIPPGEPEDPLEVTGYPIEPPSRHGFDDFFSKPPVDVPHERGDFNRNRGEHVAVTDASKGDNPCGDGSNPISGNPIVLSTGDKIEPELDFVSAGEMPLTLQRTYNHFWKYLGLFGKHWTSSFDYSLVWQNSDALIFAQRPDGRRIKFIRVGVTNRWNEDKPSPVAYIVKNADNTYTHTTEGNGTETYDGGGKPLVIRNAHGIGWTYTYAANHYPTQITHTSGRFVQLTWTSGQLTTVTDPAGAQFAFAYTANAFGSGLHRLASATRPGVAGDPATTISYFYEDARYPGGLTGKAYNGVRYSTFAFDDQARAIKSEHSPAGTDRFTYVYSGAAARTAGTAARSAAARIELQSDDPSMPVAAGHRRRRQGRSAGRRERGAGGCRRRDHRCDRYDHERPRDQSARPQDDLHVPRRHGSIRSAARRRRIAPRARNRAATMRTATRTSSPTSTATTPTTTTTRKASSRRRPRPTTPRSRGPRRTCGIQPGTARPAKPSRAITRRATRTRPTSALPR